MTRNLPKHVAIVALVLLPCIGWFISPGATLDVALISLYVPVLFVYALRSALKVESRSAYRLGLALGATCMAGMMLDSAVLNRKVQAYALGMRSGSGCGPSYGGLMQRDRRWVMQDNLFAKLHMHSIGADRLLTYRIDNGSAILRFGLTDAEAGSARFECIDDASVKSGAVSEAGR